MFAPATARVLVIEAATGWPRLRLDELWSGRELLGVLIWRDLKVRYRQTLLGAAWVLAQPLLGMSIFTVLFERVARFEAGPGLPYALFVLAGVVSWNLLASGVQGAGNSLLGASALVSKVYFPRLLLPLAAVLLAAVDFAVAGLLVAAALAYHAFLPPLALLLLPVVVLLVLALALGVGLWLAALNVRYRDVRVLVPFALQVWMYATPVVYPRAALPGPLPALLVFNPATGVVEALRACLLGTPLEPRVLVIALALTLLLLVSGAYAFRHTERTLVDLL
jgi:lipopolysaccharide transport system permease protein